MAVMYLGKVYDLLTNLMQDHELVIEKKNKGVIQDAQ